MQKAAAFLVVLLILALLVLGVYAVCGNNDGTLSCVRDIAIIMLVFETFVVVLLMLLMVILFARLLSTLQNQVMPILNSAKKTVDTVQGTTTFVSDTLVAPLIGIAGFGSAVKGLATALLGRRHRT